MVESLKKAKKAQVLYPVKTKLKTNFFRISKLEIWRIQWEPENSVKERQQEDNLSLNVVFLFQSCLVLTVVNCVEGDIIMKMRFENIDWYVTKERGLSECGLNYMDCWMYINKRVNNDNPGNITINQ